MSIVDLRLALPELFLLIAATVLLVTSAFIKEKKNITHCTTLGILLITAYLVFQERGINTTIFNNAVAVDNLAVALRLLIIGSAMLLSFYACEYLHKRNTLVGEFNALYLFAVLGMLILVSANNLLGIYLGLELFSLVLYALVALNNNDVASEAAIKYFLTGAVASGILLYGISIMYALTGSLDIGYIHKVMLTTGALRLSLFMFASVFMLVAVCFKLGLVPFHLWVPDVYEGASVAVAGFIAASSKVASVGFALRILYTMFAPLHAQLQPLLLVVIVLSWVVGNIYALAQRNIKRLLGYSAISHLAFIGIGFFIMTPAALQSSMYYLIAYVLMTLAIFAIILFLSTDGNDAQLLKDYKGLNAKNPWLAAMLLITMFSFAGIPPFSGFFAKFFVIRELFAAQHIALAVFALLMTVIGVFYYLRIVWLAYFEKPDCFSPLAVSTRNKVALSINCLAILLLGIFPQSGLQLCKLFFIGA